MTRSNDNDPSRRTFLEVATYVAPAILTLQARPAFAQRGSGGTVDTALKPPKGNNGVGNGEDPQPPGNPPINDGPGTGPGNPGNQGGGNGNGGGNSNAGGGNSAGANSNAGGNSNSAAGNSNAGGNSNRANDGKYAKPK